MTFRRSLAAGIGALCLAAAGGRAQAQLIEQYLPTSFDNYGINSGLPTIARPSYEAPGIKAGSFIIRPRLAEEFGYNSNPNGASTRGSTVLNTTASVSANSNWNRHGLDGFASFSDQAYLDQPSQSTRSWSAGADGRYEFGRDTLSVAYAHVSTDQPQNSIGALGSTVPVPLTVETFRGRYTTAFGRLLVTPNLTYTMNRFGSTGVVSALTTRNLYSSYDALDGGVTAAYQFTPDKSAVFVLRGSDTRYLDQRAGLPSQDSTGVSGMVGADYAISGALRARALVGVEHRSFASPAYAAHTTPVAEVAAIWTPTLRTTVVANLVRSIQDAGTGTNSSYVYNAVGITVDHEYLRNLLLRGHVRVQYASYLQTGSTQTVISAGAGATWMLTRNVHATARYEFLNNSGGITAGSTRNGPSNLILVGLEFSL